MTKFLTVILLLGLGASASQAQPKHFYTDWKFWVGEAVIVGAIVADSRSTMQVLDRCQACVESNPFLGKRPSHKKLITVAAMGIGLETGLQIGAWHYGHEDPSLFWRSLAHWGIPVAIGSIEGYHATRNYQLLSHCQPGQTVCK